MDEVNENSGATDTADTRAYRNRTPLILTALQGELYPHSDTYPRGDTGAERPVCPPVTDLDAPLAIDDVLASVVLPYGLAAQLLLQEDAAAASFFQQRYEELLARYGDRIPTQWEGITARYGGLEHCEYSRW